MAVRQLRRVSARQVEILWEFLNSNRDMVNPVNRTQQAKECSQKKWSKITERLNAHGIHKNWRGWSKYWVDYKAKLKFRIAELQSSTDEEKSTDKCLTDIEQKFAQLLTDSDQGISSPQVPITSEGTDKRPSHDDHDDIFMMDPQTSKSISICIPRTTKPISQGPLSNYPQLLISPLQINTKSSESSRHQRHRCSREARRALIHAAKQRAKAAVKTSEAIEKMVQHMANLQSTALRIEKILKAAIAQSR